MPATPFDDLFERPPTLEGRTVRLEPFAERHRDGLMSALDDPVVWRWVKIDPSGNRAGLDAWFDDALAQTAARQEFGFVSVGGADGRPLGSSRYLALRPADRSLEIGWSLVSPAAWGSGANSEAKLLMLEHAFEQLGCARVEFKTDAGSAASAARARSFRVFGDRWRDSAWYAITDDEWPQTRDRLEQWLAAQVEARQDSATI
jgi:RimJ/RimL family protein N-acetyltransferase